MSHVRWIPADQVGRHVVGRAEAAGERVRAGPGQARHLVERHERRPQHHGVADVVDAPAPGPPRQLGVLARGQELVAFPGELGQLLDHYRTGRHVYPERKSLGGEYRLHQARSEAALHRLLERRDHAGVVGGVAGFQPGEPPSVVEHPQVVVRQGLHVLLGDGPDLAPLVGGGEALAFAPALGHGVVACRPAENEIDRRQHAVVGQQIDHLDPPGGEKPAPRPPAHPGVAERLGIQGCGLRVGPAVHQGRHQQQAIGALVAEQVEVVQLHRAPLLDNGRGLSPNRGDPVGQLLRVRDRRRQADEVHRRGAVDDHFLPDRAPVSVLQVMNLVENHIPQSVERRRRSVDHVAQDLGRHDDDRGGAVDRVVPGEQAYLLGSVTANQFPVLLVGQCFEGGGVERLAAGIESAVHRILGHDGLS